MDFLGELYYKSSGQVSVSGAIFLFLGTFLAGMILAIPYLFIVEICPIAYACILLTLGYGYVIGLLCKVIIERTKMRNALVTIISVSLGTIAFTYFKWIFYVCRKLTESYVTGVNELIADPSLLWEGIKLINSVGTWSIGRHSSSAVNGPILYIVWIGEIIIIAAVAIFTAYDKTRFPFIESDDEWAKEYKEKKFNFEWFEIKKYEIESNPYVILNNKPKYFIASSNYVELKLYHSYNFSECYISLFLNNYNVKNKKNERTEKLKYLRVSTDFYEKLIQLFEAPKMTLDEPFQNNSYETDKVNL